MQATALLVVRLDNVRDIIDRTLTTLDRNPELLGRLLQSVDGTVGTVGGVANTALQPGGVVGQTVGTVGAAAGGALGGLRPGSLLDPATSGLTPIGQSARNAAGQTVRRLRDRSGAVVEVVVDAAGRIVSSRSIGR